MQQLAFASVIALLLCLAQLASTRNQCPKRCKCSKPRDHELVVDCRGLGLKRFPKVLPMEVTHLLLQHNNIKDIPKEPKSFRYLESLNLARNSLKYLGPSAFAAMHFLSNLDLSGNELAALSPNTFQGLYRLRELRLSANRFLFLNNVTVAFEHLDRLQNLTLSGNRIAGGLSNNQFHHLQSLKNLDLSYMHLRSLPSEAFGRLRYLEYLDISYNNLEEFPVQAISKIPQSSNLLSVNIGHNKISFFGRDTLSAIKLKPSLLKIEGNPLQCDCSAFYLWERLRKDWDDVKIACQSPPSLSGVQLYHVRREELVCKETLSFAVTPANVTMGCYGMPTTIDCKLAVGLDSSALRWKKDGIPLPVHDCQEKYHQTCGGSLIIRDVTANDVGEYTCYAGEGFNRIESQPGRLEVSSSCYKETTSPETVQPTPSECDDEDDCSCAESGDGSGSGCRGDARFCPCPPKIPNAIADSSCSADDENDGKYLPNDEVTYKCKRGYILNGKPRLVCQEDGTWEGRLPRCELACGKKMVNDEVLLSKAKHLGSPSYSTTPAGMGRVANGEQAKKGEWPWMGLMRVDERARVSCGVTLITDRLAVTAAHCVVVPTTETTYDLTKVDIEVSFGKQRIDQTENSQQIRYVTKIYIHQLYDARTLNYDVAVIQLNVPVTFNQYVQPVCISESSWSFEPRNEDVDNRSEKTAPVAWGVVSGFGYTSPDGDEAMALRKALVVLTNQTTCHEAMKSISGITESMMCAYGPGDTCKGDSGGPLVVKIGERWYLVGVTSWGDRCGTDGKYGVYARVANPDINAWIHQIWDESETT